MMKGYFEKTDVWVIDVSQLPSIENLKIALKTAAAAAYKSGVEESDSSVARSDTVS